MLLIRLIICFFKKYTSVLEVAPAAGEAIAAMQEAADVSRADLDALDGRECPVCLGDFTDPETSALQCDGWVVDT